MKNLIVCNFRSENNRYTEDSLFTLVKIQIENSLDLGWNVNDMTVISNKEFEYLGIKSTIQDLNSFCFTGSKMFAVQKYLENNDTDVVWAHDLDLFADVYFECPDFKDVGITQYSRPKINGGSIIWRKSAVDIINDVVNNLKQDNASREEPTLSKVLKNYTDRVTVLNETFNVGSSGFVPRYERSVKPVHCFHFHPCNTIAWETHVLDRTGIDGRISKRLEKLIRKYYPNLATQLSDKGQKRRLEKIAERKK